MRYGQALTFPVEITNRGSSTLEWLDLDCQLRRVDGALIQSGHVFFSNIAPSATAVENAIYMTKEQGSLTCRVSTSY